jgi:hypothetical protein
MQSMAGRGWPTSLAREWVIPKLVFDARVQSLGQQPGCIELRLRMMRAVRGPKKVRVD